MGIFYDAMVELLGTPTNFAGEILLYTLAWLTVMVVGSCGFVIVAAVLRRLAR